MWSWEVQIQIKEVDWLLPSGVSLQLSRVPSPPPHPSGFCFLGEGEMGSLREGPCPWGSSLWGPAGSSGGSLGPRSLLPALWT